MSVRRLRVAQQPGEVGLPGRRRQQVVSAHHLIDALRRVVDHHGEVVGGNTVAATDHEVIDDAGEVAVQQVVDGVHDDVGAQPQCGRPTDLGSPGRAFGLGEVAARPGIGALRSVRRPRSLGDIPSAAITFVQQSAIRQIRDRRVVSGRVLGLPLGRLIPRQADRRQIVELAVADVGIGAVVEIVDANQETTAGRMGEQPRQHGGTQIADVQVGRRARREPARSCCHALSLPWSELPAFARPPTRCPQATESRRHAPAQ